MLGGGLPVRGGGLWCRLGLGVIEGVVSGVLWGLASLGQFLLLFRLGLSQ